MCKYYKRKYQLNSGTAIITAHLWKSHSVVSDTPQSARNVKRQLCIENALAFVGENPRQKKRRLTLTPTLNDSIHSPVDPDALEVLYTDIDGSDMSNKETTQTCQEWPLTCSLSRLWRRQLSGSSLLVIALLVIDEICLILRCYKI
jgi:hypothetical protein